LNNPPGADNAQGLKGELNFKDPEVSKSAAEVERVPTPPPLRPTGTTADDNKSLAEKLLELEVTQKLFKTYDGVAEKFGAPNVEKVF
jgi:hypothetical protein